MTPYRDITDEEWQRVAPLLPELRPRSELRGRPLANTRSVLNGVLWVIYSGATWSAMPRKYPSYQTCHRRFKATAIGLAIVQQGLAGDERCIIDPRWYRIGTLRGSANNVFSSPSRQPEARPNT
ncbi:transposase [Paraburkholderia sp. C35]|uniref:transposase n=1 Tax=Paraburkholderia sp. C35 TaxID=2126993 RepID=UPI0013A58C9B|nr:transposase [Paraburkholderia sp. C35]